MAIFDRNPRPDPAAGPEPTEAPAAAPDPAAPDPAAPDDVARLTAKITKCLQVPFEAGRCLRKLRGLLGDEFAAHVEKHFGLSLRHAQRLIRAAATFDTLRPTGRPPQSEHEIRPIAACQPAFQLAVWKQCIARDNFAEETMREVIAELRPKPEKRPKPRRPKPRVFRLPGCRVTIEPTRAGVDVDPATVFALLLDQLTSVDQQTRRAA